MPQYNQWTADRGLWTQDPGFFSTSPYRPVTHHTDVTAAEIPSYVNFRAAQTNGSLESRNRKAATAQSATAQAAGINAAPQGEVRKQQMALLGQLTQAANGQGPSAAQSMLTAATDRNLQQSAALANSQRGGMGGAAAARQVQAQAGVAGQQAANDAATLRVQEQQAAMGMLSQLSGSVRGQDMDLATQQAGLQQQANLANAQMQQQANLANLQSEQGQRQLNQQAVQYYLTQGMDMAMAQQRANFDMQQLLVNQNIAYNQIAADAHSRIGANRVGLIGAGIQGGAKAASAMFGGG